MCVRVNWDDTAKSILVYSFERNWTLYEGEEVLQAGMVMQKLVNHPVDAVFDLLESTLPQEECVGRVKHLIEQYTPANTHRITVVHKKVPLPVYLDWLNYAAALADRITLDFAESMDAVRHNLPQAV